jgi:DNA invertase Pin-like site-specific DNA recombinase
LTGESGTAELPLWRSEGGAGTLERPALKRLLADVESGLIYVIVTYELDRLSRSLTDFVKLIDVFERYEVVFVSVTQQFNTTTSMGRLTLHIVLSFAQFEREGDRRANPRQVRGVPRDDVSFTLASA